MIGIGSSSRFSILKSCKEPKAADQVFTNALMLVLVFASLFFFAGFFASHHFVKLLGANSEDSRSRIGIEKTDGVCTGIHAQSCPSELCQELRRALTFYGGYDGRELFQHHFDYLFIFPLHLAFMP